MVYRKYDGLFNYVPSFLAPFCIVYSVVRYFCCFSSFGFRINKRLLCDTYSFMYLMCIFINQFTTLFWKLLLPVFSVKRSGNALAHALAKLPLSISNGVNGDVLLPAVMLNLDLILKVCSFPQKKLGN